MPDFESGVRRQELIERREGSQLTIDEVCEQAGVARLSFYYWQRRLRDKNASRETMPPRGSPLVPVNIVDDRVAEVTVELSGEIRMRIPQGCDESTLARVVKVLLAARGEA